MQKQTLMGRRRALALMGASGTVAVPTLAQAAIAAEARSPREVSSGVSHDGHVAEGDTQGATVRDGEAYTSEGLATRRSKVPVVQSVSFDKFFLPGSSAPWVQTSTINPARAGDVLPSGDDFFIYDADGRQHRYNELYFDAAKFDIGSHKTGAENWDRMRDLLQYVGENMTDADRKTVIVIPNVGAPIDFAGTIEPWSGSRLEIQGHIRFAGGSGLGGFVGARPRPGAGNRAGGIEICGGGLIDVNMRSNVNAVFVSNRDAGIVDATTDIWLHHLRIRGSRHGGGHDLDTLGNRGGKGITAQFGIDRLLMHDIYIDDCDIGMSLEAKSDGYLSRVSGDRIFVNGSRYMGLLLAGSIRANDFRNRTDVWLNMHFRDCCTGTSADARYAGELAEFLGVITSKNAFCFIDLKAKIISASGRITPLYGGFRHSRFDIDSWASDYHDIIQPHAPKVHASAASPSLYNYYKVKAGNQSGNCHGYIWADSSGTNIDKSKFDIEVYDFNNGADPSEWPEDKFVAKMGSKMHGSIWEPQFDNIAIYEHGIKAGEKTLMPDNSVMIRRLRSKSGTLFCKLIGESVHYGIIVAFDTGGSGVSKVLLMSARRLFGSTNESAFSHVETSSAALNGATGASDKITVSVRGGNFYFEQRLGSNYEAQIEELR